MSASVGWPGDNDDKALSLKPARYIYVVRLNDRPGHGYVSHPMFPQGKKCRMKLHSRLPSYMKTGELSVKIPF